MRKIAATAGNYKIPSYYGASILTFFVPLVHFLLRAKSLRLAGRSLTNNPFLIASNIYIITAFLSVIGGGFSLQIFAGPPIMLEISDFLILVDLLFELFGFYSLPLYALETA